MIPTIEDILDAVRTSTMSIVEAMGHIDRYLHDADDLRNVDLRDHFAAMALPALIEKMGYRNREYSDYAEDAYGYADAMMQARKP